MATSQLNNINIERFLKDNWQRQHLFISQGLPNFESPLDPSHLAGLSLEEHAESRLILENTQGHFDVEMGPFEEDRFECISAENWTLLVQAVDHWLPEINDLKTYFSFIPAWRMDDIMISYAPTGGSVGPHFDQYDVFLIQASGERRWKIGQQCNDDTALLDNQQVKILQQFDEQQDYLCKPGDILYVPPGCAHWGVSESDDCMTISVGFRAPSIEELTSELLHQAALELSQSQRYLDPLLKVDTPTHQITKDYIEQIKKQVMASVLNDNTVINAFGKMMTEPKYAEEFTVFPVESGVIRKRPDARLAYYVDDGSIILFANGEQLMTTESIEFIDHICNADTLTNQDFTEAQLNLLVELIDLGVFEDA